VVITWLSRALRSLKHVIDLAAELQERGIGLVVLKQQIGITTPTDRPMFAIDVFQRELIVEVTHAGLAAARVRGKPRGRKPKLSEARATLARELYDGTQHTIAEIAAMLNAGRSTLYRTLQGPRSSWALRHAPSQSRALRDMRIRLRRHLRPARRAVTKECVSNPTESGYAVM
jgi:DNA invertase Pin-like site-specific DNA recombinase